MQPMVFIMHPCWLVANTIKVELELIVLAASQIGCMINTIDCILSKLPPDDE